MGYRAFETNVLMRIEFDSVAMPFAARPDLGVALKQRGKRVAANHVRQASWTCNLAAIQNNTEALSEDQMNAVIRDAYVPGNKLRNPGLRKWFSETDSWWFDNVRRNLDEIESHYEFAIGASLAMDVGDYVLSFDERTRELRQPLSIVFRRLWEFMSGPFSNSQNNNCQNMDPNDFLAESFVDLMFLNLSDSKSDDRNSRWREEWIRGNAEFWPSFDAAQNGKLGSRVASKSQYLQMLETTLSIASNIKHWAISLSENGFVTPHDVVETVNKFRQVEATYSKDFAELTGSREVIITA